MARSIELTNNSLPILGSLVFIFFFLLSPSGLSVVWRFFNRVFCVSAYQEISRRQCEYQSCQRKFCHWICMFFSECQYLSTSGNKAHDENDSHLDDMVV